MRNSNRPATVQLDHHCCRKAERERELLTKSFKDSGQPCQRKHQKRTDVESWHSNTSILRRLAHRNQLPASIPHTITHNAARTPHPQQSAPQQYCSRLHHLPPPPGRQPHPGQRHQRPLHTLASQQHQCNPHKQRRQHGQAIARICCRGRRAQKHASAQQGGSVEPQPAGQRESYGWT
jgi:hypothetical protein